MILFFEKRWFWSRGIWIELHWDKDHMWCYTSHLSWLLRLELLFHLRNNHQAGYRIKSL